MKLAHYEMENVISITNDAVSSLVIENRDFFRRFAMDISTQINGGEGTAVLSDNGAILDFSKNADLTDSFLNFTLNRKSLLNKIISALEKAAVSGDNYTDTAETLTMVESYINRLTDEFDCNLACGKITAATLLKAVGVTIVEDYDNPLEQILDYMELVREFDRDRLFIFVNMRLWFSDEDLAEFFFSALAHEFKVFLLDGFSAPLLPNENRLTIDDDLCEF